MGLKPKLSFIRQLKTEIPTQVPGHQTAAEITKSKRAICLNTAIIIIKVHIYRDIVQQTSRFHNNYLDNARNTSVLWLFNSCYCTDVELPYKTGISKLPL